MSDLELVTAALLLGTARSATLPAPEALLPAEPRPARRLLDLAASVALRAAAGRHPARAIEAPAPAEADLWPEASVAAGALLEALLTHGPRDLLTEWLARAADAELRPPPRLLPALLDEAVRHRGLRAPVVRLLDRRGKWLAAQHPRWGKLLEAHDSIPVAALAERFETGSLDERATALAALRRRDPAEALRLLRSTWRDDGGDERARFLPLLSEALSLEDEPLLEVALDDRKKSVRESAAELLALLPGSAWTRRMIARAEHLVVRGSDQRLRLELPHALPADWLRDGVREQGGGFGDELAHGKRQRWAAQVLAAVPLSHWTPGLARTPAELLERLRDEDRALMLAALGVACTRSPDPAWATLLVAAQPASTLAMRREVLSAVPADDRLPLLHLLLAVPPESRVEPAPLVEAWAPLDEPLSRRLAAELARVRRQPSPWAAEPYGLAVAHRLHPAVLPEVEALLEELAETPVASPKLDAARDAIRRRRTLLEELSP